MTFAYSGNIKNQETAETQRHMTARFVSKDYRELYGFARVNTCHNCCNLGTGLPVYCTRFTSLPGIKDEVYALDDMVCNFWGIPKEERDTRLQNEWAKQVYERDSYTCQSCGARECEPSTRYIDQDGRTLTVFDPGVKLHAHHIKAYALYPNLAWVLENGITLCEKCHRQVHRKEKDNGIYPVIGMEKPIRQVTP